MEPLNLFQSAILIPILGILAGIIIPISVFIWLYYDAKNKQKTMLEISKNLDDPSKVEELIKIFEERKKEPIDFRRSGVIYRCWLLFFWCILFGLYHESCRGTYFSYWDRHSHSGILVP